MTGDKAKILLVEDNIALSGVIQFNLTRAGYQVTAVNNGREAIAALERGRVARRSAGGRAHTALRR